MDRITSIQNEYIKQLCKLNSVSGRKEMGLFIIEGHKLCHEAIQNHLDIQKCLVTEKEEQNPLIKGLEKKTILISDHIAKKLSSMETVPGIFMVIKQKNIIPPSSPRFILALDHVSDPSNLGAIIRSAEAFGVDCIYLSNGCVDIYSPKVLRAAMGSAFRVPFQKGDLSAFLNEKKNSGYTIWGAGLNRNYLELPSISFNTPSIVIIGNESNGITEEIMSLCDHGLFIPMLGKNESLNAAVAASIILWEQSKWK